MPDLGWKDAIIKVLEGSAEPMHYTDIAEAIVEQGLRSEVGATPAASVAATISMSLQNEGEESQFIRVTRGNYTLREKVTQPETVAAEGEAEEADETGLINAFGMYWSRANVLWTSILRRRLTKERTETTWQPARERFRSCTQFVDSLFLYPLRIESLAVAQFTRRGGHPLQPW